MTDTTQRKPDLARFHYCVRCGRPTEDSSSACRHCMAPLHAKRGDIGLEKAPFDPWPYLRGAAFGACLAAAVRFGLPPLLEAFRPPAPIAAVAPAAARVGSGALVVPPSERWNGQGYEKLPDGTDPPAERPVIPAAIFRKSVMPGV